MDGFRTPFRGNCRTRAIGWAGAGRAIWIPAWHSLDSDRCDARRRRARYDCSLRLDPAWRKNARSNGEGRNWTRRWPARSRQCPAIEAWFRHDQKWLAWAIMIYGLAASVLPVWMLLTPRDYLSTFLKLGTVAMLAAAVFLIHPPLQMPGITKFIDGSGLVFAGPVFPFVCITIACGAVSGFHSLIASGTTPKMLRRESRIRSIGYGAMVTEMMVALMAMIAACVLQPGEYFAINTKGTPTEVVERVSASGFSVTEQQMTRLAANLGESTMFNRAGGAPTFAVGMAHMFARVSASPTALALWYHFAIMFEALFILTTIDAGTRVGRF